MWPSLVLFILVIVGLVVCLVFFPRLTIKGHVFQTFYWPPLLGAIIALSFGLLDYQELGQAFITNEGLNPPEIIVLFLSMAFISIVLDEAGFFSYLAHKAARRAGKSQVRLFFLLYGLASLLTVFTSNDIVILTFTPFILFFAKEAKIKATPYFVAEFVAANSWSMLLLIGNPTNIYLGTAFGITFLDYLSSMWLPTLLGGLSSLGLLYLFFAKSLKEPISSKSEEVKLKDKPLALVSLTVLGLVIVLLAISNLISLPMWIISLSGALVLLIYLFISDLSKKNRLTATRECLRKPPYAVVPFLLSMFVLVYSLKWGGVLAPVASYLEGINPYLGVGLSSFLAANLLNNNPMSVLFSVLIHLMSSPSLNMVYAAIISSNLVALLTPIGALAGLMWESLLAQHDEKFSLLDFFRYVTPIGVVSLIFSFLGLFLLNL